MERTAAIVLVSGSLALGAPTCLCEASDARPVGAKTGMNPIVTLPFVNLIISPLMGCYDTTFLLWPLEIGRYV